mmetsp:Transcript_13289/g.36455  ORF Transcript_13289/g.36455 Transcript_13289/m.36455 type:complete len:254 (+) Transcript_13289:510-1271(+)
MHAVVRSPADGNHDVGVNDLRIHYVHYDGGRHAPIRGADDGQRNSDFCGFLGILVRAARGQDAPSQAFVFGLPPGDLLQHDWAVGYPFVLHGLHRRAGQGAHGSRGAEGDRRVREEAERADRRHGRGCVQRLELVHVCSLQEQLAQHLLLVGGDRAADRRHLRELQRPTVDEGHARESAALLVPLRLCGVGCDLRLGCHPMVEHHVESGGGSRGFAPSGHGHLECVLGGLLRLGQAHGEHLRAPDLAGHEGRG